MWGGAAAGAPRRMRSILSLKDLEPAARRFLPRPIFGYVSGAAEDERSYAAAQDAWGDWAFLPRVLRNVAGRSQTARLLGRDWRSPFGIAPMGMAALSAYRGDVVMARAAGAAGVPFILSGSSLIRLEEVIEANPDAWFQAYLPGEAARIDALLDRAAAAGFGTLVVTVDVPVGGNRENLARAGFSSPLKPTPRLAWDGAIRPRWIAEVMAPTLLRHGMPHFENSFAERGAPILSRNVERDFSARDHFDWSHIARIRERWRGSLVLKGVVRAEDVAAARAAGIDAAILSNHAGRQLDGMLAPLRALPAAVSAAGEMPVLLDSGVRRGADVLKALALGARFVLVGRPMLYAAALAGEAGTAHAIALLRGEIDRNLALLGCRDLSELGPELLTPARETLFGGGAREP
ncbi:MAG: alpha-hydroxy acid oxidase [Pseudomonadota bacterium]